MIGWGKAMLLLVALAFSWAIVAAFVGLVIYSWGAIS